MVTVDGTPQRDGFRMPGEFEPHSGCWILWPERPDNWRLGAKPAQAAFAGVARAIAQFEPVTVAVSRAQFLNARRQLPATIKVVEISYDDSWIRDTGPTFVVNGEGLVRGVDWEFRAWSGPGPPHYVPWDQDALLARKVLEIGGADRYASDLVLEGGSIHADGEGTLLTTEECLLNRNPDLSKAAIEEKLGEYLHVQKVVWLGRGVYGDGTSGHVDNLCCFVRPGVVALTWTDDRSDPQWERSVDAYQRLSAATDARGGKLEVHNIHQPGPLYRTKEEADGVQPREGSKPRREGDRLPASYINFYIANGGIVAPSFGDGHDEAALARLQELFPRRRVVSVPAREILLGGGGIHCIVQQVPRG
jgi:agmatine deiminase